MPTAPPAMTVEEARRVRRSIVLVVIGANFAAAAVMFVLLNVFLRDPGDHLGRSLVRFVVVCAVAFPGSAVIGTWLFRPIERWLVSGRPPTAREEAVVLGGPRLVALLTFAMWIVTAVIIGGIEVADGRPAAQGARNGSAVLAAGLTSTALSYLLVERHGRPLVAVALAGRPPTRIGSLGLAPRLLLSWALGSAVPLVAIFAGEVSVGEGDPRISSEAAMFLVVVGLVAGAVITANVVKSVAVPIAVVRDALGAVQQGDLAVEVAVDDGGEVGQLQAGVNQMVEGLRERQRLADLFGRHVGTEVARRALDEGVSLGGERRGASALFVDLRDSTALAASAPPEEVVGLLNRFFAEVVDAVTGEGGWVNKFEGDGAMCIFGTPATQPDHAARALRAARRLHARLATTGVRAAIGVSSGDVVAGNVGSEERYEYTVIGDPVNEASRLTTAAKEHEGHVLASGAAVEASGDEADHWAFECELSLRGRSSPTRAYVPVD